MKILGRFYYLPKICQKTKFFIAFSGFHERIGIFLELHKETYCQEKGVLLCITEQISGMRLFNGELWAGFLGRAWELRPSRGKGGKMCSGGREG